MRPSFVSIAALLSLVTVASASTIACGGAPDESVTAGDPATSDGADEEIKAAVFGDADNGKTVQVVSGRSFTIALADNGASTGYAWKVTAVDRSLGYPKESTIPGDVSRPGSPGTKKFTWKTKSPLDLLGQHKITIAKVRPWQETAPPAATYELTVEIVDGTKASTCGGLIGKACASGSYCEFSAKASCGIADQTGTCQTKPQMCPMVVMPVCGCDGKTYNNGCEANRAGISVSASGPCAAN
jgi:predicted secreted protein